MYDHNIIKLINLTHNQTKSAENNPAPLCTNPLCLLNKTVKASSYGIMKNIYSEKENENEVVYHQSPWSFMAAATLLKPAMLLPATREGRTPSVGVA